MSFVLSDLGLNLSLILAGGVMVESLNRVGILFIDRGEIFLSFSIIELGGEMWKKRCSRRG